MFFADYVHSRPRWSVSLATMVFALPALALLASANAPAARGLEAKDLIGYAVESVGPRHEAIDRAIEAFRQRDYDKCLELLETARKNDPMLPPSGITFAKLFFLSQQEAQARGTLEKVVKEYPTDPEAFYIFAEQALLQGQITDAQLLLAKATELTQSYNENPKRRENFVRRSYVGLATVAEAREDWATSVQYLEKWLRQEPDNITAYHRLGRAQFMLSEHRSAYETFTKAAKLNPDLPSPDVIIARLFQQQDDMESAEKFMDRAMKDTGANLKTQLAVVRWLMETNQTSKVRPRISEIVEKNPKSVDAQLFMGIVARMMNDTATAQKHLEQAYLLAPQNFDAANQLALFLITQDDPEQKNRALTYAETNARIHNSSEAGISLGWVYYQLGRTKDAETVLNQALRAGKLSADSSYFVAHIFYDRGRNDPARTLLESALKSKQVFVHRTQAKALLNKIGGGSALSTTN